MITIGTFNVVVGYNNITTNFSLGGAVLFIASDGSIFEADTSYIAPYSDIHWSGSGVGAPLYTDTQQRRVYFRARVDYSNVPGVYQFMFTKQYVRPCAKTITASVVGYPSIKSTFSLNVL